MKITKEINDSKLYNVYTTLVFSHRIEENCSAMVTMCFSTFGNFTKFIVNTVRCDLSLLSSLILCVLQ